jgi:hypothetical protein
VEGAADVSPEGVGDRLRERDAEEAPASEDSAAEGSASRTGDLPDFVSRVMQEFDSRLSRKAQVAETTEMGPDELPSEEMEIEEPRKSGNTEPRREIEALKDLFTDD